jgi:tetratricopeptide (TPR) repeat protein
MRRDLVFFLSGLSFGLAAGYFVFRALLPDAGVSVSSAPASDGSSSIGLDARDEPSALDEKEVRRLEVRAKEDARDAAARAELGRLYMDAERYAEAVPWLEEATKLEPADLHVRSHLAITYLNLGRSEQAAAAFQENLSIDPHHPASLLGLGRIKLYVQKDIRGGLAMWEKLVEVAPESPEAKAVSVELEALKSAHGADSGSPGSSGS